LANVKHADEIYSPSKSVMNVFAPEFSALMTILRSVGPVISTLILAPVGSAIRADSGFVKLTVCLRAQDQGARRPMMEIDECGRSLEGNREFCPGNQYGTSGVRVGGSPVLKVRTHIVDLGLNLLTISKKLFPLLAKGAVNDGEEGECLGGENAFSTLGNG